MDSGSVRMPTNGFNTALGIEIFKESLIIDSEGKGMTENHDFALSDGGFATLSLRIRGQTKDVILKKVRLSLASAFSQ